MKASHPNGKGSGRLCGQRSLTLARLEAHLGSQRDSKRPPLNNPNLISRRRSADRGWHPPEGEAPHQEHRAGAERVLRAHLAQGHSSMVRGYETRIGSCTSDCTTAVRSSVTARPRRREPPRALLDSRHDRGPHRVRGRMGSARRGDLKQSAPERTLRTQARAANTYPSRPLARRTRPRSLSAGSFDAPRATTSSSFLCDGGAGSKLSRPGLLWSRRLVTTPSPPCQAGGVAGHRSACHCRGCRP